MKMEVRSNHFPNGQAFIVFSGENLSEVKNNKEKILNLVNELVKEKLPVKTDYDGQIRTVKIGNFSSHRCGGTHVKNTFEIGEIIIRNIKKDKDNKTNLRIGYDIR